MHLRDLRLNRCDVTDEGAAAVGRGCPKLQTLYFGGCVKVTGSGARAVAEGCRELQILSLWNCAKVTDEGVRAVGEGCPSKYRSNRSRASDQSSAGMKCLGGRFF